MIKAIGRISVAALWLGLGLGLNLAEKAIRFVDDPIAGLTLVALCLVAGILLAIDVLRNGVE